MPQSQSPRGQSPAPSIPILLSHVGISCGPLRSPSISLMMLLPSSAPDPPPSGTAACRVKSRSWSETPAKPSTEQSQSRWRWSEGPWARCLECSSCSCSWVWLEARPSGVTMKRSRSSWRAKYLRSYRNYVQRGLAKVASTKYPHGPGHGGPRRCSP